jgi:hypothetical protein
MLKGNRAPNAAKTRKLKALNKRQQKQKLCRLPAAGWARTKRQTGQHTQGPVFFLACF